MCLYSANAGINSGEICNLNFVETSSSGEEGEHTKCVQHSVGISKFIFIFRFHCFSLFTDTFQQIFVFFTESNSWRVTLSYWKFTDSLVDAPSVGSLGNDPLATLAGVIFGSAPVAGTDLSYIFRWLTKFEGIFQQPFASYSLKGLRIF